MFKITQSLISSMRLIWPSTESHSYFRCYFFLVSPFKTHPVKIAISRKNYISRICYWRSLRKRCGSIHGDPSTFLERVFFRFFWLKMPKRSRKHFWWKKLRTFLSKIARSRSFFRNVFGIARNTQKISGKSGNISKKIFLGNFLRWMR